MPTVSTMPAMPGKVSVALRSDSTPKIIEHVHRDRDVRENAEQSVGQDHEHDHERAADVGCELALVDRVLAEARADDALLDRRQFRRQCAGAQQDRKIVGAFDGEVAGNLAVAGRESQIADDRRGDHLVVEHDRERPANIFLRHGREFARAGGIEAERHDRLAASLLIKSRLRIDQFVAGDEHLLLHQNRRL